jgi:hypothetical protein
VLLDCVRCLSEKRQEAQQDARLLTVHALALAAVAICTTPVRVPATSLEGDADRGFGILMKTMRAGTRAKHRVILGV